MSHGTYACHADTVKEELVSGQCPEIFQKFTDQMDKMELEFDQVAEIYDEYNGMEVPDEWNEAEAEILEKIYRELLAEFEKKIGLSLGIRYHCPEDIGDETDGAFWEVDGVYVLSAAGKKYKDSIERLFWTTNG